MRVVGRCGLWHAVKDDSSPSVHWRYERLGTPPGTESDSDAG